MLNEEVDGCSYKYDVFLSFRGEDTYCTFTGNLYHALRNKRIKTFFFPHQIQNDYNDNEQLEHSPILKAIRESRSSIVVLSENFASSTRCLDELENIIQCRKMYGHLVWPIFYKVYPSEVRLLSGRFGEAVLKLEERFRDYPHSNRMQRWKQALSEVTVISGWIYETEYVL